MVTNLSAGLELLKRYEQPWNLEITLKPVALGYVFQVGSAGFEFASPQ
jgi:hypothetical protein